ncbi:hypothetical protein AB6A40_002732 [Gnathostoma spinigerum]|uniref:Alkylglycerol monooxygenase n=1 Tax=Gnathostoma spinigerum TaxID=75299 RepID=A0ABD6E7J5_9BILA
MRSWFRDAPYHCSSFSDGEAVLVSFLLLNAFEDVGLAIYDVLQAFFIPPSTFLVHRYFSEIYQFTLHTSLFDNYGPLGIVLNTPSHHRVHHGRNPYCIDRNYGGVFIIWDKLFGTFEPERTDDRPVYGLITREKTFNQLWLQFHTLKELLLDKWRMKDEKGQPVFQGIEKLKAIFFPPGYFPGSDVFLFFHWWTLRNPASGVPEIEDKVVIFNPPIPLWLKIYCFLHFLILLDVFTEFEHDRQNLQWSDFWLKLAFFIATMQCFGAIFDRSSLAPLFELLRCIGVLLYYANLVKDENGVGHHRFFMIIVLAFSSTASVVLLFTTLVEQLLSNSVITSIVNKSLKGSDSPSEVAPVRSASSFTKCVKIPEDEGRCHWV